MRYLLAVGAVLSCAVPASAQGLPKPYRVAVGLAAAADVISSQRAFRAGANEDNPFMPKSVAGMIVVESGIALAIDRGAAELARHGHRRLAKAVALTFIAGSIAATIDNVRVERRLRRRQR